MATTIKKNQVNFLKPIGDLFRRFHLLLFFILIVGCLSAAIVLINNTLTDTTDASGYTSSIHAGSIDEAALQQIQSLHKSSQPQTVQPPAGRTNPFGE